MRAETEDRLEMNQKSGGDFPVVKLLLAVAVLAGLLLFWYFGSGDEEPVEAVAVPVKPAVIPEPEVAPAPDIPERPEPEPVTVVVPDPQTVEPPVPPPLPTPEEADEMLREQLEVAGADAQLNGLIGAEDPMDVSAKLLDGASKGTILRKILPASAPTQAFSTVGEGEEIYMSPEGYQRYNAYADSIASLDTNSLVDGFHNLRPLYERAYEQLGLDPADFDNAIIRTLDLILATPEIESPIALERESVMYTYADPELEALPEIQKQLLRMGPDNIRRIKAQAQQLRDGLLAR